MQEQLNAVVASLEAVGIVVSLNLHITRGQLAADVQQERQAAVQGRPKIGEYVARAVQSAKSEARSTSMVLAVCGPESMADEVQLVARDLQTDILHSRLGCLQEVYLLKEAFGW